MDFNIQYDNYKKNINDYLESILPKTDPRINKISESMKYSIYAGGKRVRPILCLSFNALFKGNQLDVLPYACAIECIHTYSLIHDDLPALDNDDLRRGKPTNHKVFGEDMAILAGDALLNLASEIIFNDLAKEKNETKLIKKIKAGQLILNNAGVYGMIGGQVADLSNDLEITEDNLDYINLNKTSKLIEASIVSGAILGEASDEDVNKSYAIAKNIGLAFQIKDDILDIIGNQELLGKDIGSDQRQDKKTYPMLIGIDQSIARAEKLHNETKEILKSLPYSNEFIDKTLDFLLARDY